MVVLALMLLPACAYLAEVVDWVVPGDKPSPKPDDPTPYPYYPTPSPSPTPTPEVK